MLRLPRFQFRMPTGLDEAASVLAQEEGETRIVAGGTDLYPNMKRPLTRMARLAPRKWDRGRSCP